MYSPKDNSIFTQFFTACSQKIFNVIGEMLFITLLNSKGRNIAAFASGSHDIKSITNREIIQKRKIHANFGQTICQYPL